MRLKGFGRRSTFAAASPLERRSAWGPARVSAPLGLTQATQPRLLLWLLNCRHSEGGIVQLLSPLSAICSFFILLAAGTTALSAYGA